jgi:hypothetical protein
MEVRCQVNAPVVIPCKRSSGICWLLLFMWIGLEDVSDLRPPTGLFIFQLIHEYWRATVEWYWQGKPKNSEEIVFQDHFTANPRCTDPGANPVLICWLVGKRIRVSVLVCSVLPPLIWSTLAPSLQYWALGPLTGPWHYYRARTANVMVCEWLETFITEGWIVWVCLAGGGVAKGLQVGTCFIWRPSFRDLVTPWRHSEGSGQQAQSDALCTANDVRPSGTYVYHKL